MNPCPKMTSTTSLQLSRYSKRNSQCSDPKRTNAKMFLALDTCLWYPDVGVSKTN